MSADVRHDAEDQEPELRVAGKAPAKKPLAEFLAAFEQRLANHPDEAATGALRAVEERAAGLRRSPAEASPARYAANETEEAALGAAPEDARGSAGVTGETGGDITPAETSGESRRIRGRRRKHRHRAH